MIEPQPRDKQQRNRACDDDVWASIPKYMHEHIEERAARHCLDQASHGDRVLERGHLETIRAALLAYRSLPAATVRNFQTLDAKKNDPSDRSYAAQTAQLPSLRSEYEAAKIKVAQIDAAWAALAAIALAQPAMRSDTLDEADSSYQFTGIGDEMEGLG